MATKDRPALINRAGEPVGWDALAAAVSGPFRALVRSDDLEPVAVGLLQAFYYGRTVRLADPGAEAGTGETPAESRPRQALAGRAGIMELLAAEGPGKVFFLTSGTTGPQRQVAHGRATLARGVRRGTELDGAIWGNGFHPAHMAGVQVLLQALATGNPCVQLHGLTTEETIRRLGDYGITHLSATPSWYRFLLPELETQPRPPIRRLTLGGEAFDPQLAAQLRRIFPAARLRNIYATTEAGSLFVADGDCFRIGPAFEGLVQVVEGELWIASKLLGETIDGNDWYATGDLVEVVEEKPLRIRITGRKEISLNVGGYRVHPEAIEAALCRHPSIAEARVHGRPQALVGHLLMADCVPVREKTLPEEAELRRFLGRTCQPHEIPRIFRIVERIDRTPSGKVRR